MVAVSDQFERPKVRIQRRRLGRIKYVEPAGKFGFIDAEDFRDDVFFHHSVWEAGPGNRAAEAEQFVEFELDEDVFLAEKKLRASVVRLTNRPDGAALEAFADPHLKAQHHPNARRKRPSWRNKS